MQQSAENQIFAQPFPGFARRLLLFVLPLLVVVIPALTILLSTTEVCVDIDRLVARAEKQSCLIGFAYNNRHYSHIKFRRLVSLPRQSVVALGSSRVLQFREEMFDADFFNVGYTIVSPWDFRTLLKEVPPRLFPSTLIIGLDQFMFNLENNRKRGPRPATTWTVRPKDDLTTAFGLISDVYKDLSRRKIQVGTVFDHLIRDRKVMRRESIGLNSLMNCTGMRNDGSFLYGRQIDQLLENNPAAEDYQFKETLSRIHRHGNRFEAGHNPDHEAVEEIGRLLDFCEANGIHVIGFFPPFTDTVWQAMQDSGDYGYTTQIESALRPMFDEHGFELYAFHCMADCNATDQEAIDGFHAGEQTYLKILIAMLQQGSLLNDFTNLAALQKDLTRMPNRYTAYAEPPSSTLRVAQ